MHIIPSVKDHERDMAISAYIRRTVNEKLREDREGKEKEGILCHTSHQYINSTGRKDPFNLAYVVEYVSKALSDVKHAGCTSSFFREESAGPPPS